MSLVLVRGVSLAERLLGSSRGITMVPVDEIMLGFLEVQFTDGRRYV